MRATRFCSTRASNNARTKSYVPVDGCAQYGRPRQSRARPFAFVLAIIALAFILNVAPLAQPISPDWRLVGFASDGYLFYDAQGLRKLANGHFEVWLKGLPAKRTEKAVDKLANDKGRLEHMYQKIKAGYVPPVGLTRKLTKTEIWNGLIDEEIADAGQIEPEIRMLVEIDCADSMSRRLSLWVKQGQKSGSSEKVADWEHIAPETNFDTLRLAICPSS
jgi:hypothetical protein